MERMELNKILHPDLLPEEELHQILNSLSINVPSGLSKPELLEIFKKVAVPLPQRNKDKPQAKLDYISAELDLGELSLSNDEIYNGRISNCSKKIKLHSPNEERKDINDLIFQLEKDCDRMVVDVENVQISKANHCKIVLKRSYLFEKDENAVIVLKKTRNWQGH